VLRATIEAKGLVHQWAARLPVGDPDARALRTLMAAAAQVAQLYADIPRWDHLQEVRLILEGLRVTGLWLEVSPHVQPIHVRFEYP
jgi:hypothetical protein